MEEITLYHGDVAVTRHILDSGSFSVGRGESNDLVLADDTVGEQHLVILRGTDGKWHARNGETDAQLGKIEMDLGSRIQIGRYALELGLRQGLRRDCPPKILEGDMVGESLAIRMLQMKMVKMASLRAPVLVRGESGTGKELVASGLHYRAPWSCAPFVVVNCGGLTGSLLEDTFFGHEKGAYTGATKKHKGVFEQAHGGTLFLDEIGELPLSQQAALLRVLDDGKVRRIGAIESRRVLFRLVTATNRDLLELVSKGRFRLDLYHRIAALELETHSLRQRPDDIAPLAVHFFGAWAKELGERFLHLSALRVLEGHSWPGNIRELKNVLYRSAALCDRRILLAEDLILEPCEKGSDRKTLRLSDLKQGFLEDLMARNGGNVAAAAREIGVPRTSLRDRMRGRA